MQMSVWSMVPGYARVPGIAKTRGRNANTQCFICK